MVNFILNKITDRIYKTLFICSPHFTADLFLNNTQFDALFRETENKRCSSDYIGSDSYVTTQECTCTYFTENDEYKNESATNGSTLIHNLFTHAFNLKTNIM